MGYTTKLSAHVTITPPIRGAELNEHQEWTWYTTGRGYDDRNVRLAVTEEQIGTPGGDTLLIRWADTLEVPEEWVKVGIDSMAGHLTDLVHAFPGHDFTGWIDAVGEEPGDVQYRFRLLGRGVDTVRAELCWPDVAALVVAHHPEVYVTDGTRTVGWHCLTCDADSGKLASLADADRGVEHHIAAAAIAEFRSQSAQEWPTP